MDRLKPTREIITQIYADMPDVPMYSGEEIVRCKDCRHSRIEGDTTMFMWCGYWNKPTDGTRYCSDGERIDNEGIHTKR